MAVALLALALYVGVRQGIALRRTGGLPEEERRYEHRKAWRRLASSVLLLVMAGLLITLQSYAGPMDRLARERESDDAPALTPQQKLLIRAYFGSWIALLI